MDEESYQKIAKLHETAILPQVQKYSTSYGLHGPTRFGDDPQTNGLSYGKWLAAPKEKPTIVDRHPVARISPSAAMLAPLYDILASLEEQVAREIAESNEDVSYERPSCVPAVRGRRSVHHRMATDF
ncbi:hypothetical protein FRC03_008021 [Tulasnella sp. 419]|nr:hypothetical protein FRC03_008021 [Tulasnella sp. 419]